ncbi:hypothetical protein [Halalkalicoccus tibetensis]|uniref:FaeA-like protein n=1 Tax=Halalkalicoccus tibetensis TaxID=175632 RepID=A0ABD5UYF0_9EURY
MANVGRKPRVTDDELLDEIFELTKSHDNPVVTTQEVTDGLPLKKDSVYDRLNKLHDEEKVLKKKVGAKGVVWWLSLEEKVSRS